MSLRGVRRARSVALVGAGGRLGTGLAGEFIRAGYGVMALGRADLDVRLKQDVENVLGRLRPAVILNCSAYNAVDAAEHDPAPAYAVNALGPSNLASVARDIGAILVHYSTDFVFDGTAREPYSESAAPGPLNVYGASKLAGELEASKAPRHFVLRLESLFGGSPPNGHRSTIDRMADVLRAGRVVHAVGDRTVSPSYVPDVASATRALLERHAPFGLYHCVNSNHCTWHEMATFIADILNLPAQVEMASSDALGCVAERPKFCALSNQKLRDAGIAMPDWRQAVTRHFLAEAVPVGAGMPLAPPAEIAHS